MSKYLQESYDALLKEKSEIIEQNKKLLQLLEIASESLKSISEHSSDKASIIAAVSALDQLKE